MRSSWRSELIGFRLALVHEETPSPPIQNVAPNLDITVPSGSIVIPLGFGSMRSDQGDASIVENAPIVRYWLASPGGSVGPNLLLALWHDGTIIWVKTGDRNLQWRTIVQSEYYRSKISEKQVNDFLSAFDKLGILEYSGRAAPNSFSGGLYAHHFFLGTDDVQFRFQTNSLDSVGNLAQMRPEIRQMIAKRLELEKLLHGLIPARGGERIDRTLEVDRRDQCQAIFTPVPFRPAAGGNMRDTGAAPLEQPIFPPRNTVVPPVRPR